MIAGYCDEETGFGMNIDGNPAQLLLLGYPREAVVELLIPTFLPFNLIKGGLNAAITMILYKPIVTALGCTRLIEANQIKPKTKLNVGLMLIALWIIIACILLLLSIEGVL